MTKLLSIFCIVFWFAATSACLSVKPIHYDDDKAVARKKVEQIHQLYNQRDYSAIYGLYSDRIKNEMTEASFISSMKTMMDDNGPFVEAREIDSQVVPQASVREVRLKYSSKYQKGWLDEGFALFVDGNNAIVDMSMANPANATAQPKR